jgi:hypothetical protein
MLSQRTGGYTISIKRKRSDAKSNERLDSALVGIFELRVCWLAEIRIADQD